LLDLVFEHLEVMFFEAANVLASIIRDGNGDKDNTDIDG
jgi:hypothetical protein